MLLHVWIGIALLVGAASSSPPADDFRWIDDIIPSFPPDLHGNHPSPGTTAFNQVAHALQTMYPKWGINASSLPFPPEVYRVNVTMSDGTPLYTIVVNPWPYKKQKGACLVRSPYGSLATQNLALIYTVLNGFVAVMQEDRGFFSSGGTFDMWQLGAQDGNDTIHWVSNQTWSNGEVYSIGASADGIASGLEVIASPKQLKGEWLIWTTLNGHHFVYPNGAFRKELMLGYMDYMSGSSRGAATRTVVPAIEHHEAFGPWWYNLSDCVNVSDPHAVSPCYYHKVNYPMVLSVGWWDIFQKTELDAWNYLRTLSSPSVRDYHVLFVGPLGHCIAGVPGTKNPETLMLQAQEAAGLVMAALVVHEFFAGELNGPIRQRVGRVNIFVMGAFDRLPGTVPGNFWTSLDDWPKPSPTKFFLSHNRSLTSTLPLEAGGVTFKYDPRDPTPMIGGNNLPDLPGPAALEKCGSADQASRENRSDLVMFDSEVLPADLSVVGSLSARLFVSSTARDTDFVVTLSDLTPRGQSMLVRFGIQRMRWRSSDTNPSPPLIQGHIYQVDVQLDLTAYIFPKGHKLRFTVASAAAPYFNPTSNTGANDMIVNATPVVAANTVHFGSEHASWLMLPVVGLHQIPSNTEFHRSVPGLNDMLMPHDIVI